MTNLAPIQAITSVLCAVTMYGLLSHFTLTVAIATIVLCIIEIGVVYICIKI